MMITIMQVTKLSEWLIDLSQLPPTHGATFWVHLNQIHLCMWNGAGQFRGDGRTVRTLVFGVYKI